MVNRFWLRQAGRAPAEGHQGDETSPEGRWGRGPRSAGWGRGPRSDLEGGDSLWSSHLSLLPLQADVRVADHGVRRMAGGRSVASHSQLMAIITRCKQSCV